jgi:hypothetical protein
MRKSKNCRLSAGMFMVAAMLIWNAGAAQAQISTYTDEAAYLTALAQLGYRTFQEGFENDAVWGSVRQPNTAPSVSSQRIVWQTNHPDTPASNEITTGMGPAHTGQWGVYDPDHGYATGAAAQCDVDNPPSECLYHDGFSGTRAAGQSALHGVGGFFTGTAGSNIAVILDGTNQIALGKLPNPDYYFFGVIDAGATGFTRFEFRELDGKVGQVRFIFGDDFTFGTTQKVNAGVLLLLLD